MSSCTCNEKHGPMLVDNARKVDPTKTLTLRNRFSQDMSARFRRLMRVITISLVDNNALGLGEPTTNSLTTNTDPTAIPFAAYALQTDAQKIDSFMEWLLLQIEQDILEVEVIPQLGTTTRRPWTDLYITSAYKKGISRGRTELLRAGYDVAPISVVPGGVDALINTPVHAGRAALLYTRTFNDLKGITDVMSSQIARELSQAILDGVRPSIAAKRINDRVKGIGLARSRVLARTEIIRAHHVASIEEYRSAGVLGVRVEAEFKTAGDSRVCPICKKIEAKGKIYTLDEIMPLIPVHPNCRCIALPIDRTDEEE